MIHVTCIHTSDGARALHAFLIKSMSMLSKSKCSPSATAEMGRSHLPKATKQAYGLLVFAEQYA